MDILFLLIPLSLVLILGIVGVFGWAVHAGQFDDLEREGERLLSDEGLPSSEGLDRGQGSDLAALQQFQEAPRSTAEKPAREG
jgi:cbb3-type cytochrome oxidase maturation protein